MSQENQQLQANVHKLNAFVEHIESATGIVEEKKNSGLVTSRPSDRHFNETFDEISASLMMVDPKVAIDVLEFSQHHGFSVKRFSICGISNEVDVHFVPGEIENNRHFEAKKVISAFNSFR